jgi:uncharacterized protein (TIGR02246 family)
VSRSAQRLLVLALVALGISFAFLFRAGSRRRPQPRSKLAGDLSLHAAIAQTNAALLEALHRSDPHGYAEQFAEDALSMPGFGPIVRGRGAIEAAMACTFAKLRFVEAEVTTIDTRVNGESVLETGSYRYVVAAAADGARTLLTGRYIIVWKRVGDCWKIALDAAQPGAVAQ